MDELAQGIKGGSFFSGKENFLASADVQQWVRTRQ